MGTDLWMLAEQRTSGRWMAANVDEDGTALELDATGRNYVLFDLIGGRFGGEYSQGHLIQPARGLPPDVSPEVERWAEPFVRRASSGRTPAEGAPGPFSWLLVSELIDFDWTQTIEVSETVDPGVASLFADPNGTRPTWEWPKSVAEGVEVSWREPLSYWTLEPEAWNELRSYGPPGEVRVVFWFS